MPDQHTNNHTKPYESLHDLKLLGLWSQSGRDWSSTIKQEIHAVTNQPPHPGQSNLTNKVILFAVLGILGVLVTATWMQSAEISQAVQEVGKNSVKELILTNY